MAKWRKLSNEKEYHAALKRIDELMDIKRSDDVYNELSLLSFLVEAYEEMFHTLPDASPNEVIRFVMEMKKIKPQKLEPVLGTKGNVSKILNGKGNLRLEDIYPLSQLLGIPMEALIPKNVSNYSSIESSGEYVGEPQIIDLKSHSKKSNTNKPGFSYGLKNQRRAAAKKVAAKKKG